MRDFYLNILGLNKGASPDEIKKAYRKKVFEYHPDKNPSPKAEKMFLLVSEAYKNLSELEISNTEIGNAEQSEVGKEKYHKKLSKKELEERLRKAKAEKRKKEEKEKNILHISLLELENSYLLKLSNWIASVSLFIAFILFADLYVLQSSTEFAIVNQFEAYDNGQKVLVKLNKNDAIVPIATSQDDYNFQVIRSNYLVELYKTPLLGEIAYVRNFSHRKVEPMVNYTSFNSSFWIIFSLFFLPISNFVFKGANSFYIIFVHLNIGIPIIGLLILLSY